jgi:hypothetical protein
MGLGMRAIGNGKSARSVLFAIGLAAVLALSGNPAQAASVTSVPSGRPDLAVILIDGMFEGGETLEVQGLVGKLPARTTVAVILNSPGGSIGEGFKLGRFFHQARVPTFALGYGGICMSACAIAFLGGRDAAGRPSRTKMYSSKLGFHQFHFRRDQAEAGKKFSKSDMEREVLNTRALAFEIIKYLSDIGEGMSFLHLMLKAPTAEITLVSNEDAVTYGINVMDESSERVIDSAGIKARVEAR